MGLDLAPSLRKILKGLSADYRARSLPALLITHYLILFHYIQYTIAVKFIFLLDILKQHTDNNRNSY